LDSGAGAAFEGGASSVRITATFIGPGRLVAACAGSSIAAPDFNATSVQIASGLNRRNGLPDFGSIGYLDFSADCSAFAAPIAVVTCRFSSGGGSTAFIPSDWIHSSRHQPLV